MPTITVTEEFASVMQILQNGGIILKRQFHSRNEPTFYASQSPRSYNTNTDRRVNEQLIKDLLKLKLIEDGERSYFNSYIKKVWKISFAGQKFPIPPPAFWVHE
jgi:hypothetical protein